MRAAGVRLGLALLALLILAAPARAATIVVDTDADEYADPGPDSGCSPREAIEAANGDADFGGCAGDGAYGADTVVLGADDYALTIPPDGTPDDNADGDLDVTESLTIAGAGEAVTTIDAAGIDRAIDVQDDGAALVSSALTSLTLSNGAVSGENGGALRSRENDSGATQTLSAVSVLDSAATNGNGGGVAVSGAAALSGASLARDMATGAAADGGGLYINTSLSASIAGSALLDGDASDDGGAVRLQGGRLTIDTSTIESNDAASGGGVSSRGTLTVTRSTFAGNRALGGCLAPDEGAGGGGVELQGATAGAVTIENSTMSGNTAACAGGAIYAFDTDDTLSLRHATIAGNRAGLAGGGVHAEAGTLSAPVSIRGTILSYNLVGGTSNCAGDGTLSTAGSNLESANGCRFKTAAGDIIATDPLLGPLAFNGGTTRTQVPFTTSRAVNGVGSGCPSPAIDQRGHPRPFAGRCDIGSVETSPGPFCRGRQATIPGSEIGDTLTGTAGPDVIVSGGGNDTIDAGAGKDIVCAEAGDDLVRGGRGKDKLYGGAGRDKLVGGRGKDLLDGGSGKDRLVGSKTKDKLKP